jgi:hypothetical protein
MTLSAGSICKFNCCQNGRDLPEDNSIKINSSNGNKEYSCGCPPHFFVILSPTRYNKKKEKDWSKMSSSNNVEKLREGSLTCVAVPLDKWSDANRLEKTEAVICPINVGEDAINKSIRPKEEKEFVTLTNSTSAVLCHKICRINISSSITNTIALVNDELMEKIINNIDKFLEQGKRELAINFKKN